MRIPKIVYVAAGVLFLAGGINYAYDFGRFPKGTKIGGVEVGRMKPDEAVEVVRRKVDGFSSIKLVWEGREWIWGREDVGWQYDLPASIEQAELRFNLNEEKLINMIAGIGMEIDIPAREPEVVIEKVGEEKQIKVYPGENGREVDAVDLRQKVLRNIKLAEAASIEIPVRPMLVKLTESQINEAGRRSELILNKKVILKMKEGDQKWEIADGEAVAWMDPAGGWRENLISEWVKGLSQLVNRPAQNAALKFIRPGRVEEFKPAKPGWVVDEQKTTRDVVNGLKLLEGENLLQAELELAAEEIAPKVDNEDVNNLGIKELIGRGESWFSGSITNRIYNLKKSAETLNGILVAPGEVFSFNKTVGEISAATGYRQAYIIKEGKTILGDGGGVCQVSSTLFRAVLAAGLPIPERTAHAYRVHYYEEKYQVGFDATVFQPAPDFKFTNDTPAYILIQTEFDEKNKHLVFNLYGTSDGRKVEVSKSRIWDQVPPPPDLYQDDPTLPMGKIVQTEHAAWGAKVAFDWKVTRGDEVLQERTFYSNYRPWQAVYLRGTKTN
ncbi:hypothetical protein A2876_01010 [Candidatus Amesbacteria bacterium RIFCSPHIGHO2_01_FULL_48_32b]|uniref:YoaR-like putative peptidoglycan binding domain-containing protein n=1 Tax=Candidatus Amesbacteria bacterium RIFCSPHIGHO2_01_FULL_48_32b TaxID=1797253 RepID=A0A1F4YGH4_9BACT|nr:MAG: hypothetical protein A2876_01010 [Candidatus Amesbacteria bacterium RIFCSPHIGHO2_01_FULL_48_32b]